MTMHNMIDKLIGVPFVDGGRDPEIGLDCWGTVMQAYKLLNGINVTDFKIPAFQEELINKAIKENESGNDWYAIEGPERGCVVAFKLHPIFVCHVGVCIDDKRFIHAREKTGIVIEHLDHPIWRKRIHGYYKWAR